MITLQDLSFYFGSRPIYDNASLQIKPKDRIGLVGANGTGKSTLLRIIDGEYTPDSGSISMPRGSTVGFLNQDLLSFESDAPILEVAMQAFERELAMQAEIDQILAKMEHDHSEETLNRLAELQEQFETLGGYGLQAKAEAILEGLGFTTAQLQQPLRKFSGGWRMRVMLAKLLLMRPTLLMLDEPTNHLDLPSIEWLENYLQSYEGAVIIVSHDRTFLDGAVNTIVEVRAAKLDRYTGNYSSFLAQKEERHEVLRNAYENQQKKIKDTERFVERFRAKATKAKQAQSRLKALERMDRIEMPEEDQKRMNFHFVSGKPSGKQVLRVSNLYKSYGDLKILEDSELEILRGDKIALIGANGRGKSTVLRILANAEEYQGERNEGAHVRPAFFAQHQLEALHLENNILQEVAAHSPEHTEQELRTILGSFMFSGEEVEKKIGVLSGGEKSRVALAKVLLSQANFLLLDEPTNHLDINAVETLTGALQEYDGTFVTVSHDRRFVSDVANKIWWIENQELKSYTGTYAEFLYWQEQQRQREEAEKQKAQQEQAKSPKKEKKQLSREAQRARQKEISKAKKAVKQIEEEIENLEAKLQAMEVELSDQGILGNPELLREKSEAYEREKQALDTAHEAWEEAAMALEELDGGIS